jgi:hypothetical protein
MQGQPAGSACGSSLSRLTAGCKGYQHPEITLKDVLAGPGMKLRLAEKSALWGLLDFDYNAANRIIVYLN